MATYADDFNDFHLPLSTAMNSWTTADNPHFWFSFLTDNFRPEGSFSYMELKRPLIQTSTQ